MLANTEPAATNATRYATSASTRSNHEIFPNSSVMIAPTGYANVIRLPCLLIIISSMKPAVAARSWINTALTSVAAFGSCPLIVCTPLIGIHTTLSAGVFVGAKIPVTVKISSCWFFSSNASP